MQLPIQTFAALVEQMAATVQGSATQFMDFSVGSVVRALMEACAAVALWLQWLILLVLAATRAATSQGSDLDSWMADFTLSRLPGAAASGVLTFSRYTAGLVVTIQVGTTVVTTDGSTSFTVVADPTNPAWNGSDGYGVSAAILAVNVPAQAVVSGSGGNVLAGSIGLISSPIPGIDAVTNNAPFAGGLDAEADAAFRTRFQLYINSRSLATVEAIGFAIISVQQGVRYVVLENQNILGQLQPGNFCVFADDGTGVLDATLQSEIQAAVEIMRPAGSTYSVTAPQVIEVTVSTTLVTNNPLTALTVQAAAQQAISAWINALPIGGTLAVSKIDAICHDTDPSVISVTNTLVNGAAADLLAATNGVFVTGGVAVG